jgi:hypothetical protein
LNRTAYNAARIETDRSGRIIRDAYTHLQRNPYGLSLGLIALSPLSPIGSIVTLPSSARSSTQRKALLASCALSLSSKWTPSSFSFLFLIDDSPHLPLPASSYIFQTLGASIDIPLKTTFFYDLAAASGFITTTIFSLFYPSFRLFTKNAWNHGLTDKTSLASFQTDLVRSFGDLSTRQVVIGGMIIIWAVRLGSFLFHVSPTLASATTFAVFPDHAPHYYYTHTASPDARQDEDSRFNTIKSHPRFFAGVGHGRAKPHGYL